MISAWWLLAAIPVALVIGVALSYVAVCIGIAKGLNW